MKRRAILLIAVLPTVSVGACVFSNESGVEGIDDPSARIDQPTTSAGGPSNSGIQGGRMPSSSTGATAVGVTSGTTGSNGPTTGVVATTTSGNTSSTTGSVVDPTTGTTGAAGDSTSGNTGAGTSSSGDVTGSVGGSTGMGRVTTGGTSTGGTRGGTGTTGARSTTGSTTGTSSNGGTGATTGTSTSDPLNAAAKCTSGKTWTGGNGLTMRPGENCVNCHSNFRIAGTVFPSGHEPNDCNGANGTSPAITVIVTDSAGADHSFTVNNVGNFESSITISTPYKARVTANGKTRSMTASQTVGACNSCHTATGLNSAPGRITVPF